PRRRVRRPPGGLPAPVGHRAGAVGRRRSGYRGERAPATGDRLHQLYLGYHWGIERSARSVGPLVAERVLDRPDRRRRLLLPVPRVPSVGDAAARLAR